MLRRSAALVLVGVVMVGAASAPPLLSPPPARASLIGSACGLLGTLGEGWWGKACNGAIGAAQQVSSIAGKLSGAGGKVKGVVGKVASNGLAQRAVGLAGLTVWVLGGAKFTLDHLSSVIDHTSSPSLTAAWFTGVYLRIEAVALLFTLLFLFAAATEALLRQDVGVLARAALVYLPLGMIATALATPLVMVALAVTDQLSAGMATLAGADATHFLTGTTTWVSVGLATVVDPFFAVLAGGLVVAAGGALWVEMLIREIAVYVIAAMLPLVFAAMVWPARRVWAIRAIEVLVALIVSKFFVVAVLALGSAALAHTAGSLDRLLGGLALVIIGAFTPWVLLRLIPTSELAAAAIGHIRGHAHGTAGLRTPEAALAAKAGGRVTRSPGAPATANGRADIAHVLDQMVRNAQRAETAAGATDPPSVAPAGSDAPLSTGRTPGATPADTETTPGPAAAAATSEARGGIELGGRSPRRSPTPKPPEASAPDPTPSARKRAATGPVQPTHTGGESPVPDPSDQVGPAPPSPADTPSTRDGSRSAGALSDQSRPAAGDSALPPGTLLVNRESRPAPGGSFDGPLGGAAPLPDEVPRDPARPDVDGDGAR